VHASSHRKMEHFVDTYLQPARGVPLEILDFGSQQVNPASLTYRTLLDRPPWRYRGLDIEPGHNVDVCVRDAYDWPEIESDSIDVVVSGQAFEHVEYFWASAYEIGRVLRPGGLLMLIAPSGGYEHRFPLDCWRYYTDGMHALAKYVGLEVIDAYTDWGNEVWEDSVLVARKPIMSVDEENEFARRLAMQKSLLSGAPLAVPVARTTTAPPSALPAPTPGELTARLAKLSAGEKVKGRVMWFGERFAGRTGRRLASRARARVRARRAAD
jgi:SAM-dependent methyltransferase